VTNNPIVIGCGRERKGKKKEEKGGELSKLINKKKVKNKIRDIFLFIK
jgi:hypothetical protein